MPQPQVLLGGRSSSRSSASTRGRRNPRRSRSRTREAAAAPPPTAYASSCTSCSTRSTPSWSAATALQEAVDDAVQRGRMTHTDAATCVTEILSRGRRTTEDLLGRRLLARGGRPTGCAARSTAPAGRPALGAVVPDRGYDDLTAAQVQARLGDLIAGRAAQGARLRAPQREPQDGAAGDRVRGSRLTPQPPAESVVRPRLRRPHPRPAAPRRRARARRRPLAYGGNGVARLDGYVVFVARRPARRPRARPRGQEQARLRRGAHRRGARAEPGPHRAASPTIPARRGRCCPYERQLADQGRAGRGRAAADRPPRRLRARADRPGRSSSGATATSSSTRSATTTTAS